MPFPHFDLGAIIQTIGLFGVLVVVFAESGLLVGFFLPGDSLLFTAGFLASQELLPIVPLVVGTFLAAVAGDSVGYAFGSAVGTRLYARPNSRFFRREHLERTEAFFARYGARAIVLARFMPVVRTFTPILAGVGHMPYRTFITYNLVGGLLWGAGIPLAGYWLGSFVPNADRYILPLVLVIVATSILPPGVEWWRARRRKKKSLG